MKDDDDDVNVAVVAVRNVSVLWCCFSTPKGINRQNIANIRALHGSIVTAETSLLLLQL